jgi:hypothetical protein
LNENTPLPVDTGRGFSINYLGKNLYSKYDPSKNPEKIIGSLQLKDETLYIVPSPLLLYGVESLLKKLPESSYVLALEIDQKLMGLTLSHNVPTHKNLKIVRLDSRETLKIVLEDLGVWRFRKSELLPLNYGYNLYKEKYDYLFNFASHLLSTFWRNRLTLNKLGKLWINNIFTNIPKISNETPDNLNKAVIICGAGSSLEESVSLLRVHRKNLYIIAVDTALSALLKSGIKPDLVIALEAQFYNLGDFYDSINMDIDLLTDITGYPAVCRKLKGKTYFFTSEFVQNKLLDRVGNNCNLLLNIPPLGSVGVAAVYIARELFNTDIFLTGLDFSFVPGKSHCKSSPFSNFQLRTSNRLNPAGSYGIAMNRKIIRRKGKNPESEIQTDNVLESYAMLLKDIISRENRIYDLTSTGYPVGAASISEQEFIIHIENISRKTQLEDKAEKTSINSKEILKNELQRLEKLILIWESFTHSVQDEIPENLMQALEDVDYIYVDFPDRLPHPLKEISFITRAIISAREYIEKLHHLIE